MLFSPPPNQPPILQQMVRPSAPWYGTVGRDWRDARFDVTFYQVVDKLEVGATSYPLRSPLRGFFYPGRAGEDGEFVVREFGSGFVGRGKSVSHGFEDWRDLVHTRFQELYAKRPFEMTGAEREDWHLFEDRFDVTLYRNTTPLTSRMIGRVSKRMRPHPEMIEWEDGSKEKVRLDQMPGEFARYKPNTPFEAIVERDPLDSQLLRVIHVRKIGPPPRMTEAQFAEFIESIPTTESLPETDWE